MTISPITFVTAAPVTVVEKLERVKRRPKSAKKSESESLASGSGSEPTYAATSPEEFASDETRSALLNIRLGG